MNLVNVLDVCTAVISGGSTGIPDQLAHIIALAVKIIQIVVPILLIIWGMLDLGKAVMAQKEDEIKKGQQTFVKRLIAAAIVFFIVTIVKLVIGIVAGDGDTENGGINSDSIWGCIQEILNS